jgi:hypothetical protein
VTTRGEFTTRKGESITVDPSDKLTFYKRDDRSLDIDNLHGVHIVDFASEERDRALAALQADHYVWEDNVQVNPNAANYGKPLGPP